MFLIVGLGNPGAEYAGTRHNVGFAAADAIASAFGFGAFRSKFDGLIAEGKIGNEKVYLLKPQTYMNLSGNSVVKAASFYIHPFGRPGHWLPGPLSLARHGGGLVERRKGPH